MAWLGVFPAEGFGGFLIEPNVAQDLSFQICNRGEDAAIDGIPLELSEPALDLIEPRRVGWGEVECHVGMLLEDMLDQIGLVRGEVIQDNVHVAVGGLVGDDFS